MTASTKRSLKVRTKNRMVKFSFTILLTLLTIVLLNTLTISDHSYKHMSGWIVFIGISLLALFNLRKKLNFIPLGSAALWAQVHYYVGIFISMIFLAHVNLQATTGTFNLIFAATIIFTILTGVFGLFISRVYPPIIAKRGQQVVFDRIPIYRKDLQAQIELLITRTLKETKSTTLVDFYNADLLNFLSRQQHFFYHLIDSMKPSHRWKVEFSNIRAFLNEEEQKSLDEIELLTRSKITLDLNQSIYQALRYWLFIHIPFSYLTLILACIHGIQMTSFSAH